MELDIQAEDGTKVVIQALIRHGEEWINDTLLSIKPGFSISEITNSLSDEDASEIIEHIHLCDEVENLIRLLLKVHSPIERIGIRNNTVRLKVYSVECQHFPADKIIVTKYFLHRVF